MMCNKTIKLAAAAIAAGVLLNCSGCGLKTQENNNSVSSPTQTADSADTDSLAKAPPPVASKTNSEQSVKAVTDSSKSDDKTAYLTGAENIDIFVDAEMTEILSSLSCGSKVIINGTTDQSAFSAVKVASADNSLSGYVMNKNLTSDRSAAAYGVRAYANSNTAVYDSAAASAAVIGEITEGSEMAVLAKTSGGRWRIMTDDLMVGYVSITDLDVISETSQTRMTESAPAETAYYNENGGTYSPSAADHNNTASSEITRESGSSSSTVSDQSEKQTISESYDSVLSQAVSTAQANIGGNWSAAYIDLTGGGQAVVNNSPMQAASLIKLFIMGAVYENYDTYSQTESGLDGLLDSMITVSDNTAANTLVGILGSGNTDAGMNVVTSYAHSKGCTQTSMGRLLLQSNINGDNYTSALDCANFLSAVYNGQLAHSSDMLGLLSRQTRTNKIPAGVPAATANKTGELDSVQNDAAIVFADKPYVLCVMSENVSYSAADAIASLSSAVYSGVQ